MKKTSFLFVAVLALFGLIMMGCKQPASSTVFEAKVVEAKAIEAPAAGIDVEALSTAVATESFKHTEKIEVTAADLVSKDDKTVDLTGVAFHAEDSTFELQETAANAYVYTAMASIEIAGIDDLVVAFTVESAEKANITITLTAKKGYFFGEKAKTTKKITITLAGTGFVKASEEADEE